MRHGLGVAAQRNTTFGHPCAHTDVAGGDTQRSHILFARGGGIAGLQQHCGKLHARIDVGRLLVHGATEMLCCPRQVIQVPQRQPQPHVHHARRIGYGCGAAQYGHSIREALQLEIGQPQAIERHAMDAIARVEL